MNSHGAAKVKDVIDYLLNVDGLYKHIRGAANPKADKTNEPALKATHFLQLKLLSNLQDSDG